MHQHRDLNRTREGIMTAAQKEFAANGFAGARTDAIARGARVNEHMIFLLFPEIQRGPLPSRARETSVGQGSLD